MTSLPFRIHAEVFMRSLLIQSGWNYRTMIGSGVAFAMIPVLRYLRASGSSASRVGAGGGAGVQEAVGADDALDHYGVHFNAHPYLASAALGSLSRMEVDGAPPEMIARFRDAVRGPLGALGDRLVWAAWLPVCSLIALAAFWAGAGEGVAIVTFLLVYNTGHLALRIWGFRTGWDAGAGLGRRLRDARLPAVAARVERLIPVATGLLVGVAIGSGAGLPTGGFALGAAGCGLVVGAIVGPRAWKPAAAGVVIATGLAFVFALTR